MNGISLRKGILMDRRFTAALLVVFLMPCRMSGFEAQDDKIKAARSEVESFFGKGHVAGLSVAVSHQGRIIWSQGFGLASLEHRTPVWPWTKFRIASISKSLTSVAVARLWQEGKLDLDAPVQRYAPTFPDKGYPITTRQLAGHLSGLPHYTRDDIINTVHYGSVTEALAKFQDRELLFEPGEKYSYSSFGYNLIGVVVEGASGQQFLSYMQSEVFEPLGMRHTIADHYGRIIENRTEFYQRQEDGTFANAPAVDNSDVWAAGGFLSTAEDLVRFGQGIIQGKVLKPSTLELLFTPMQTASGKSTGYGLGWRIQPLDGIRTVGHSGSHIGASSRLVILPEQQLVIVILTNTGRSGLAPLSATITRIFLP